MRQGESEPITIDEHNSWKPMVDVPGAIEFGFVLLLCPVGIRICFIALLCSNRAKQ
jgi:hypothetical protein